MIAEEVFTDRRELLVLLPRGNGKTTLMASVGRFSLLTEWTPAYPVRGPDWSRSASSR